MAHQRAGGVAKGHATMLGIASLRSVSADWMAFERPLVDDGQTVAGIDEVGRGALAGPVAVGVVVVQSPLPPPGGLNDSKLLSAAQRRALVEPLHAWAADVAVAFTSAAEVDTWGIRAAIALAAHRALRQLRVPPTFLLLDGRDDLLEPRPWAATERPADWSHLPHARLVHGDRRSATIAAAAVLAKVARDRLMHQLAPAFPDFGWSSNVGYGSSGHLAALRELGPTVLHRRSWNLPRGQ